MSSQAESRFFQSIAKACEGFVEEYRHGRLSKAQASKSLLDKLSSTQGLSGTELVSEDERGSAYANYFDQLETVDLARRSALSSDVRAQGGVMEEVGRGEPRERSVTPHDTDPPRIEELTRRKRGQGDVEEPFDDRDESPKRPIDPTLFPFGQDLGLSQLNANLKLTLKLKENYLRDVKFVKAQIVSQPDLPDVPPVVWDDIIRDSYVDFDKIISSHFSLEGDPREIKHLGDFEVISGGSSKPKRLVSTQSDWFLSWTKYKRGVVYLYPHRLTELQRYEDYMLGQFTAAPDSLIINLDKAIHSRVGRTNTLLLSAVENFSDLYTSQVLLPSRTAPANPKAQGIRPQPRNRDEVCLRWNKDGKCDYNGCRFRHVCTTCKSNGHTSPNCPRNSTRK